MSSSIIATSGFSSDHRPVLLSLWSSHRRLRRGRGLKSFPLLLLNIPAACASLRASLALELAHLAAVEDADLVYAWDRLKARLRAQAVRLYLHHRALRCQAARSADLDALAAVRALRFTTPELFPVLSELMVARVAAATHAWQELGEGSLKAAAVLDHTSGDCSSFYFHRLPKVRPPPVVIQRLLPPAPALGPGMVPPVVPPADLSTLAGIGLALSYAQDFYSAASPVGLFRPRSDIDPAAQDTLLSALPAPLPAHFAALAEGIDGDSLVTGQELALAIRRAARGSAPGFDGLPYEFYHAFQAELLPLLVRVFNSAFLDRASDAPLAPLLEGVICLVEKPGQPKDQLAGYRPITLLNADAKLMLAVLATRLQRPLDFLIDITQSAFLRGRDIADNVRYHLGLASRLQELGLPGWLLHSDLTKAYDTADRGWLLKVMARMGFQQLGAIRWCGLFLQGTTSRVRVNGFLSPSFPTSSGLPQGSALSCTQWVILLEPFVAYLNSLQAAGRLSSLPLPDASPAPAVVSFADDSKSKILHPDEDGPVLKAAYSLAQAAGLPQQSTAKTKLLLLHLPPLEALPPSVDPVLRFHGPTGYSLHPPDVPHRLLGVPFGPDQEACSRTAFLNMAGKMVAASIPWSSLALNALGRSHVAMQCLASKMLFQANFAAPTQEALQESQRVINRFVATSSRPEDVAPVPGRLYPRAATAYLPVEKGGLGIPYLPSHSSAMRAKTCWKLFTFSAHPWQQLFRHEVAQASLPGPGLPPGYHTLVTDPQSIHLPSIRTELLRDSVAAFKALQVRRISPLQPPCARSILLELTFSPLPLPDNPTIPLEALTSPLARSWHRIADVRLANLQRDVLPPPAIQDLDFILQLLPPSWAAVARLQELPPAEWLLFHQEPGRLPTLQGPHPVSQEVRIWVRCPSGLLQVLPVDHPAPVGASSPALIRLKPKPKDAWLRSDFTFYEAQQLLPPAERRDIMEPWLVGSWEDLQLDPRMWGIPFGDKEIALLDIEVRHARCALFHSYQISLPPSAKVKGYVEERAAWPRIWSQHHARDPEELSGLPLLEASWAAIANRPAAEPPPASPDPADLPQHAWLDLRRVREPRPGPRDRGLDMPEPPAVIPLRLGFSSVWKRLADRSLHRPFRVTGYRLLHGTLGCAAFLHAQRRLAGFPAEEIPSPFCTRRACADGRHMDNLSHALLECPQSAVVIDWLLDTWLRLSGIQLPRSPALILGDDLQEWPPPAPSTPLLRLWSVLRVTTLGALWQERVREPHGRPPEDFPLELDYGHRAIELAKNMIQEAILRDWLRTQVDIRSLDNGTFCADWWRGVSGSITVDSFIGLWATPPVLCRVLGLPPRDNDPDTRSLQLLL